MVALKIRNVSSQFATAIRGTQDEVRKWMVATAKREHMKVMNTEPRPGYFKRIVDGVEGAPEESVSFGGYILYNYPRLTLVAEYALEVLRDLSPIDSGQYYANHTLLLNGNPVEHLDAWEPGDDAIIINPLPYARKIEVGAMTMRISGTDYVYAQAARRVRARFGNFANVQFTFRPWSGKLLHGPTKADMRYPVLIITEL